ncbi:MAG: glycosyltransferase [Victivallaceae bacterium]|nr:glycosyltransferase [Victivallaceae bacterium]
MKISVAIALYRGEKFIGEALASILEQSTPPDEIVLCDDSPDEATLEAASTYIVDYPGIVRYFRNKERLGVSANFEKAVTLCTGDLIFLADEDDVWRPDKIARFSAALRDGGGVFSDSLLVDAELTPIGGSHWSTRDFKANELRRMEANPSAQRELFLRRVLPAGHDMAFRAELKSLLLPFPPLANSHDSWIGLAVAMTSKWSIIDDKLTLFRQHADNLSRPDRQGMIARLLDSRRACAAQWNLDFFRFADERLRGEVDDETAVLLLERLAFAEKRAALGRLGFPARLTAAIGLWQSGDYRRFGRGALNAIQDMVLPPR